MLRNILDTTSRAQKVRDTVLSGGETTNSPSISAISRVRRRRDPVVEEELDNNRYKVPRKTMMPVERSTKPEGHTEDRLIRKLWRTEPVVEGTDEKHRTEDRSSRKIMIPVNCDSEYNEVGLLLGPGGSRIEALKAEAGGRLTIKLCGKGTHGSRHNKFDKKEEPPHVLLEGDLSCVDIAASLLNNLIRIPKISRKLMMPVERPGYNYTALLIGPHGSRIRALEAEAGGLVSILVRSGKLRGSTERYDVEDEPPHVLLYGDSSCVDRAENLINDLWNIQIVSRKIVIPAGCYYSRLLIGQDGSIIKALQAEAGGRVEIQVHDMNKPPCLLLEGESLCVHKTESLIMHLFQIPERERTNAEKTTNLTDLIDANTNNDGRSVLDRIHALATDLGLTFYPGTTLCSIVTSLENEVFSKVKSGTIKERVRDLEKEIGC